MIDRNNVFIHSIFRNKVFNAAFTEMDFFSKRCNERVCFHGVYRNGFFFTAF